MAKTPFIHLHTHSHYSLLDGLSKLPEMVALAKKHDMPALGLTDHGNMYGAIEFYKAAKKADIKPIIGVEAYIAARSRFDKEPSVDAKRYHLTLLAKNATGYRNLLKLVTAANLEGYYYKPRMDHDLLRAYSEGIVCLSGCFGSELSRALARNDEAEAERIAHLYQEIFGAENYYFEIMHHPGVEGLMDVRSKIIALGKQLNIPLVGTQDSHYLHKGDKRAHETLLAIQTSADMTDSNRFSMEEGDFHFLSTKEAYEAFKDVPEAVENTMRIAEQCDIEIELGKWVFPDLKLENEKTYDDALRELVYGGIVRRNVPDTEETRERIEYELGIIKAKGYAPYFLVVADLLRFAHENSILTTIRGSVAGSLVTFLAGITNVNPIEYHLPFERFLNPERPSAPDIDMDYADNRRDEVIEYARKKYGDGHVAQIGTFGTMLARGVVRDVARALGHPYALGDKIARLIPMGSQGFPMTIDRAIKMEPDLKKLYKEEADAREVIDLGKKLEGCVRHVSVHAAGVVISPTPLTDFVPVQLDPKGGKVITQFDMHAVEDAGLLKFDFLGIRNLSILSDAVKLAKQVRGALDLDIENIPLDDEKTFAMLARGETMGLFQLGGAGMTRYLKELKPSTIHDINAMVALYRPGPMESIPRYIERKHNARLVSFLDPRLKDILNRSYGIITYQDDVLLIAIKLAGYSWLEADTLRKAMGKKIPAEMEAQKDKLKTGLVKNGMTSAKADEIWKLIEPFAAYGFGKAHAASYGRVAYQTAYMKANFPVEYMTAVLTADSGDVEKIAEIIAECTRMGIAVLPPDINESFGGFTVVKAEAGSDPASAGSLPGIYSERNRLSDLDAMPGAGKAGDGDVLKATVESQAGPHNPSDSQASSFEADEAVRQIRKSDQDAIRFGLYTIKNFGEGIADAIIAERKTGGKFRSIVDFLERIRDRNLNKKSLEALIMCGALDSLPERTGQTPPSLSAMAERGRLLGNIEALLAFNRDATSTANSAQDSLFAALGGGPVARLDLTEMPPASQYDKLRWEKELLGLYISGHPLDRLKDALAKRDNDISKIKRELKEGTVTVAAGLVEQCKQIITKAGDKMLFATLADFSDSIEVVVFPKLFAECREHLDAEKCVAVKGRLSNRNGTTSLIAEAVRAI